MKKIILGFACVLLTLATSAVAQETPTATPTAVPAKTLTCTNSKGSIAISLCGVRGCTAAVSVNGGAATNYSVKRSKGSDGALTYKPTTGTKRKCTIVISPLKQGSRRVLNASCASGLKGASCLIN